MIKFYFSTVKILAQRSAHISAVATVRLITKTFTAKYYDRHRERQADRDRARERCGQTDRQTEMEGLGRELKTLTDDYLLTTADGHGRQLC